jgi:hypothetical protein
MPIQYFSAQSKIFLNHTNKMRRNQKIGTNLKKHMFYKIIVAEAVYCDFHESEQKKVL